MHVFVCEVVCCADVVSASYADSKFDDMKMSCQCVCRNVD